MIHTHSSMNPDIDVRFSVNAEEINDSCKYADKAKILKSLFFFALIMIGVYFAVGMTLSIVPKLTEFKDSKPFQAFMMFCGIAQFYLPVFGVFKLLHYASRPQQFYLGELNGKLMMVRDSQVREGKSSTLLCETITVERIDSTEAGVFNKFTGIPTIKLYGIMKSSTRMTETSTIEKELTEISIPLCVRGIKEYAERFR